MRKKFIPCIYLYKGQHVASKEDTTMVFADPVALAQNYAMQGADEILIFDMSSSDEEHDAALDIIKEICAGSEVPVLGSGNIKRMEDVKKLLYAGCKMALLDYDLASNVEITKEVSQKFGKAKIGVMASNTSVLRENIAQIDEYASMLLYADPHMINEEKVCELPVVIQASEIALNKLLEVFTYETVCGITGNAMNANVAEIASLKVVCEQNGLNVSALQSTIPWTAFKTNESGLVPVIVQDYKTEEVLMLAYMNQEAYETTIRCGKMCYYSRSRNEQWLKGDTSGHYQYVKTLSADCDMDTILAKVSQVGAACHTGARSCFFNQVAKAEFDAAPNPLKVFEDVFAVIMDRKINPKEGSYTNYLFDKGIDKILKKLGEEATEIVIAAKNPNANEIKYEISDFLYHMMVLMAEKNVTWEEITTELANR